LSYCTEKRSCTMAQRSVSQYTEAQTKRRGAASSWTRALGDGFDWASIPNDPPQRQADSDRKMPHELEVPTVARDIGLSPSDGPSGADASPTTPASPLPLRTF
jgi:hypothetical protein